MVTQPIDFSKLVEDLHAIGAFQPQYTIYVDSFGGTIPQEATDARYTTSTTTIGIYAPFDLLSRWMQEYFSTPFLKSPYYKRIVDDICFLFVGIGSLDDSLTLRFDDPRRKRTDGVLYTVQEREISKQICQAHPEIVMTIMAFQSSLFSYMERLKDTVSTSSSLSDSERERAEETLEHLLTGTHNTNIVHHILPAVAIHYYKNHHGDLTAQPTIEDFQQGMKFAFRSGMFERVRNGEGGSARIRCPAQTMVNKASTLALEQGNPLTEFGLGTGLYHIYRNIAQRLERRDPEAINALQQMQNKINEELGAYPSLNR